MEVSVRFWCIGTRLLYETRCMRRKAKDIEDKGHVVYHRAL